MRDILGDNYTPARIRFNDGLKSITLSYKYASDYDDKTIEECKKELETLFFKEYNNDKLFESEISLYAQSLSKEITIYGSKSDLFTVLYILSEYDSSYQLD